MLYIIGLNHRVQARTPGTELAEGHQVFSGCLRRIIEQIRPGLLAGIPAGVVYFVLFGFHFWQSLAVGIFVSSLYSVLAGILLAIVKISNKLGVDLDTD